MPLGQVAWTTVGPCLARFTAVTAQSTVRMATFLGGREEDTAEGAAVDADGYMIVAGTTLSPNFPMASPIRSRRSGPNG